jgi:tetratricopeptide (TPR) repeat protein
MMEAGVCATIQQYLSPKNLNLMAENPALHTPEPELEGSTGRLSPLLAHALPSAPTFIGREREMESLRQFWSDGAGVVSLVGLGGAGKTAVLERFVREVLEKEEADGVLVWSFYDDPDTNSFLQAAFAYFTGGQVVEAKGAGWFHLLKETLASHRRYLLVLDGLERVQRAQTDASGIYGELEDPLLRGLLVRLVSGGGASKAIITSRFPISDVEKWNGRGYSVIDIDQLSEPAAMFLMRSHQVKGSDDQLLDLLAGYGRHALTIDLLGGAINRFFGGDPANAPALGISGRQDQAQAERLAAVLRLYELHLSERELDLLSRLCVFRFGVSAEALDGIFLRAGRENVAGSLSGVTREDLIMWLDDLVKGHLVYKEEADRYTVHPAVRDHFYRLFRDPTAVHGAVSSHLMSLSDRPGIGLPTEKSSLDLLEELVYHAIKAGNLDEAIEIYVNRLGGNDHLNTRLGEYARTFRILQAFPECPDPSAMYHCMRAFGKFDQALEWRAQNRYIRVLNGNLTALKSDPAERTQKVVRFLQGEEVILPDRMPDLPISSAMLQLLRGNVDDAQRLAENDLKVSMFEDDVARAKLVLSEVHRKHGNAREAREFLEAASRWVLASGSHEHLCVLHLCRGRLLLDEGQASSALAAFDEGLQIAEESNFALLSIELSIDRARVLRARGRIEEAETEVRKALVTSESPEMQYVWGEISARRLLAEILGQTDRLEDAIVHLESLLALQRRINAPDVVVTERLLRDVRSREN